MFNKKFLRSKKALSPLIATILLVVFALVIGTITMNWGRSYVEKIKEEPEQSFLESAVIISIKDIDTPLKELQIDYITGKISEQEYIEKEKTLISG
jgi:flagellin-like protein